jgi:hypothetical protein
MNTRDIAIAVESAADAQQARKEDADEWYFERRQRYIAETSAAIEKASAKELAEIVFGALNGVGEADKLHLLDAVLAGVRDMAAARSAFSVHAAAASTVLAWDKAKDAAIRAVVDQLLREDA